jgi:hypothetical protein
MSGLKFQTRTVPLFTINLFFQVNFNGPAGRKILPVAGKKGLPAAPKSASLGERN